VLVTFWFLISKHINKKIEASCSFTTLYKKTKLSPRRDETPRRFSHSR